MATRIQTIALRPTRPFLNRLTTALLAALHLRQSRQRLSQLEPHLLRDIGLTPAQARSEAARQVWDAPKSWLRQD